MTEIWILFAVVGVGIVAGRIYFSDRARVGRAIASAKRVDAAAAPDRQSVKIEGKLRYGEETVVAPFSGRVCAVYEVEVHERRGKHWRLVARERFAKDFWVEDESGRALVQAPVSQLRVVSDTHHRSGVWTDATPALEQFLVRIGQTSKGFFLNRTLRYREGVMEAGERVAVCGYARREGDGRVVIKERPPTPLIVSDDPAVLERPMT
jgi:E3 ubiquitin ligase